MSSYFSGFVSSMKGWWNNENLEVVNSGTGEGGEEAVASSAQTEERKSLWKQLSQYIGSDITSGLSLPVWIFEPHSFLQIICEPLQFSDLLDKAALNPDPHLRLAYVAGFICGGYSCASRTKKPFNPILGETYEFISKEGKWKYFAEQVSHHPPMGVGEASGENWFIHIEMQLRTKFKGNSTEVSVNGVDWVRFPKFGDRIEWGHMDTVANNVIIGGMWVDHYGTIEFKNTVSGEKCVMKFTKAGWLGAGRWQTTGDIFGKDGKLKMKLSGKWNEYLNVCEVKPDGSEGSQQTIWKRSPPTDKKWNWNQFNYQMNEISDELKAILPPTDSRLRGDRLQLEKGNTDLASKEKHRLEEKQRAERRDRETKKEDYKPKFFDLVKDADGRETYNYVGKYWEEREDRLKKKTGLKAADIKEDPVEEKTGLSLDPLGAVLAEEK